MGNVTASANHLAGCTVTGIFRNGQEILSVSLNDLRQDWVYRTRLGAGDAVLCAVCLRQQFQVQPGGENDRPFPGLAQR